MDMTVFMHAFVPIACFLRSNYRAGQEALRQKALQSAKDAKQKKKTAKVLRIYGFSARFRRNVARLRRVAMQQP
jgi:hypothetical protein